MEAIPVPLSDRPNPVDNLRTRTFFISRNRLDNDILKRGLDTLIREHWRKLGGRLVTSQETKQLEYHVPHMFEEGYVLFNWTSKIVENSIHDTEELSKLISPGQKIDLLPSMDEIDKLLRPSDWPYERKHEPPNSPLLYVHLTIFNDSTAVAISCPHTVADQSGLGNIVKAWLGLVEGRPPPAMIGYSDDVLASEESNIESFQKEDREGRMRVRNRWDQTLVVAGIVLDLVKNMKEESHVVFMPIQLVQSLRERITKTLADTYEVAPDISNGDVLTAVFTKLAQMHDESKRTIDLSQTINLRGRIPSLPKETCDGFIHNSVHYATSTFQYNPSTPLHDIALYNRKAINKALEESDIKSGVRALREVAQHGQVMLICEPFHKLYSASNWCGAWQGIDFSKAAKEPTENSGDGQELIVLGQSKAARTPGRNRIVIMCRTNEGFWCDFAAPLKAMPFIREHLASDPLLERL
ncbi:hypothetical protein FZEAL_1819 [Fusarium zealandicum]|uniref:Uncharacterized protein n=1 Tax=Fusarium zealandicum TaxID=1053134 RepID=A0A8H4XNC6_9HYPO|nr:hypothetical protein FZEAL_1819 [Fusarium zealandicum]